MLISGLPPELLALVFEWCIICESGSEPLIPDKDVAPLLLTRISETWRNVALSTPSLWCSLRLNLDSRDTQLPLLRTWLGRSGCFPLTLYLTSYDYLAPYSDTLVDILRPRANQIISLGLYLPSAVIVRLAQWPLPRLQCVDLRWTIGTEPSAVPPLFADAPGLIQLSTIGNALYPLLEESCLPWTQFKTFNCVGYTVHVCIEVFRMASSLERGVFSLQRHNSIQRAVGAPLRSNLRSLSFEDGWDDLYIISSQLQLPALEELRFTAYSSQLLSIIPQCRLLRKLELSFSDHCGEADAAQVMGFLRSLAGMVDLRVELRRSESLLQVFLSALETDGSFLLNLEALYLKYYNDGGLYPPLMKMLMEGRKLRPLKSVTFDFNASVDSLSQRGQADLAALRQEGMDVRFRARVVHAENPSPWSKSILQSG